MKFLHNNVTSCHDQGNLLSAFLQLFAWRQLTSWLFPGFSYFVRYLIRILLRCFVFPCMVIQIIHHGCSILKLEYPVSKEEIHFKRSLNETHCETLPTYSYISPRYKAHEALTFSFRPSCRFDAGTEPRESPMTATQLCAFFLQSSLSRPLSMLSRINLVLWNATKPELCELGRCQNFL